MKITTELRDKLAQRYYKLDFNELDCGIREDRIDSIILSSNRETLDEVLK